MDNKSNTKEEKQIIGNYLVGVFMSTWLAKELNYIDFNFKSGNINCEEAFVLRCLASYENYRNSGGTYIEFQNRLVNKK